MSTIKVNTIQNTSGVEQYTCKAWVNFNGIGTVAIRASGNVSSITDVGAGVYTINFTNAMSDANYAVVGIHSWSDASRGGAISLGTSVYNSTSVPEGTNKLAGSCSITCLQTLATTAGVDPASVNVAIFR